MVSIDCPILSLTDSHTWKIPGEFGPIYEKEEYNPDWKVQNDERYDMLDKQLAIYTSEEIGKLIQPAKKKFG